jgi:mycobactin peptide synthetase MbtF
MLSKRLPRYMVPQSIVVVDQMPLTSHGKIDETALVALPVDDGPSAAPETETEAALVAVLAELLDRVEIDVTAEFLQLGLDSIVALSVVQGARRRGIPLRARLMLECSTIRELAAAIDHEAVTVDSRGDEGTGPIPMLPNAHWLYEHGQPRRLAQTETVRLPEGITRADLDRMLEAVVVGHVALRSRLEIDTMTLVEHEPEELLTEVWVEGDMVDAVAKHSAQAVEQLDPQRGSMMSAVWLRESGGPGVLMLVAHVLALDPASWRIVLGELDASWHNIAANLDPLPTTEHTSYRRWSRLLAERAAQLDTCDFWAAQLEGADPVLGTRRIRPDTDRIGDIVVTMSLTEPELSARVLSGAVPAQHILAAAAAATIDRWREHRGQDQAPPLLALETHGRADGIMGDADTSDTVGLLTAIYPLRMNSPAAIDAIPGDGIDFGLLRYLRPDTAERLRRYTGPQVLLNFLGRVHAGTGGALVPDRSLLARVSPRPEPDLAVRHELTILAAVIGDADRPVLGTQWRALPEILSADDVATLQSMWQDSLREVAP